MQSITIQMTPEMLTLMMKMGIKPNNINDIVDEPTYVKEKLGFLGINMPQSLRIRFSETARREEITHAQLIRLALELFDEVPPQQRKIIAKKIKTAPTAVYG